MKCELCKENIEKTFLDKIRGIYIKVNSKIKTVCRDCQKKYSMNEIREKLS